MTSEVIVEVRGLRKSYAGRTVVDGLDITVRAGEAVGLIGATGPGRPPPSNVSRGSDGLTPAPSECSGSTRSPTPNGCGH